MKKLGYTIFLVVLSIMVSGLGFAQTTVTVVSDLTNGTEGNLNTAIQAAITANTLSKTVFQLQAYGYYILTGTISVPSGTTLTIQGPAPGTTQATALPQIVWTASGSPDTRFNFAVNGNISLKNLWIMYANATGTQVGSSLSIQDDPLAVAAERYLRRRHIRLLPLPGQCRRFRERRMQELHRELQELLLEELH